MNDERVNELINWRIVKSRPALLNPLRKIYNETNHFANRKRLSIMKKHLSGKIGEDIAVDFLRSQGYEILERNFRSGRNEIDLIAEKEKELIFVEVKMRRTADFGYGEEAVTAEKRKHLLSAAADYLRLKKRNMSHGWRFDIVALELGKDGAVRNIEHMKDVFF